MEALLLTTANYWKEIDQHMTDKLIPTDLGMCLRALIGSHLHVTIPPEALPRLVQFAKDYLADGIVLRNHLMQDEPYDIMVFVPDNGQKEKLRSFFRLIPRWRGGRLRYLTEI